MKKQIIPKKSTTQKIFGTNSLQNSEYDASRLVGNIVEKGFSDAPGSKPPLAPSSAPQPTVLPFPVARHRSNGPHWKAKTSEILVSTVDDDIEYDGEDEDLITFDSGAALANPVQKKERKGLDFSLWRELTTDENFSVPHSKGKNKIPVKSKQANKISEVTEIPQGVKHDDFAQNGIQLCRSPVAGTKIQDVKMEAVNPATAELVKKGVLEISDMNFDVGERNLQNTTAAETFEEIMAETKDPNKEMKANIEDKFRSTSNVKSISTPNNNRDEHGASSVEMQIDAENRVRLKNMSADEIEEARAEIMAKMNPALIEVLKKRGHEKLNKQKYSCIDIVTGEMDTPQDVKSLVNGSTPSKIRIGESVTSIKSKDTDRVPENKDVQELRLSNRLWGDWSKRVEAIRELGFSLDGNVVEGSSAEENCSAQDNRNLSAQSGYSASNALERDFLRTEGDPGAAGYTIKEAIALTRSVVPGQRALALHLIASVLNKALDNIMRNPVGCTLDCTGTKSPIDWEAVWAFAIGPEPELALTLRMSLDDNHNSVILACTKVIQCVLSCDINESFFDISEKIGPSQKDLFTAPVFRSRPDIDVGFFHGGFWKYNTKPANILLGDGDLQDRPEGEHTIQDDVVIAGQDIGAGLVRMGILPRIRYLLEANPSAALEESIISILIAIARHSPTCAGAIMKCKRLVQTVVNRFTMKDQMEVTLSKIRSVSLFKVLARSEKKNCVDFIKNGIFEKLTWHLYQYAMSPNHWVKFGIEKFRLSSALMIEQLRFWKVCIQYGHCVSYFSDLFPALCIWLDVPTFEKLIESSILSEFVAITREAYLVLEALIRRLPNFYSHVHLGNLEEEVVTEGMETWCWSHVGAVVDLALKWAAVRSNQYLSNVFSWQKRSDNSVSLNSSVCSILWVISSVVNMLSSVLQRVLPEDSISLCDGHVPWLPDFVPKIGLAMIKNRLLSFSGLNDVEYEKDPAVGRSFIAYLCHLRYLGECETSIASVCCLHGLLQVVVSVNKLIQLTNADTPPSSQHHSCSREGEILAFGILESSMLELEMVHTSFFKLIATEWHHLQAIEIFGRGGPAPGIGVGWGATGGGFWSTATLLCQLDARLLVNLLETFQSASAKGPLGVEDMNCMQRINSALEVCLIAGPSEKLVFSKALDILLQVPVLKYLNLCIHRFLQLNEGVKLLEWEYKEEDYLHFCNILASHFRNRWLCVKKKLKEKVKSVHVDCKTVKKASVALDTINEYSNESNHTSLDHYSSSFVLEWAHQKLPLPKHWFLSPISTINYSKLVPDPSDFLELAKGGIFLNLGLETMSILLSFDFQSSVQSVPVVWKMHSLSVVLLVGMEVLEDEKSRDMFSTLQEVYGQLLDKSRLLDNGAVRGRDFLKFQSDIHESYSTFIETLVEQFASVSYGDWIYGRQVAIYLHRCVEAPVRLSAWNALSNARVLEHLPPIEECVAKVEGYLLPVEDNERILEAYTKSWTSGALDRAATRGSVSFKLVMHHLSSFIFGNCSSDKRSLRNKLVKYLLRNYGKQHHKGLMMTFIEYEPAVCQTAVQAEVLLLQVCKIEERFKILKEACDGNSSLLSEVDKLESSFRK